MSKRNFDAFIVSAVGELIIEEDKSTPLRIHAVNVLGGDPKQTAKTGEEKMKRMNLAFKMLPGGDIDFTIDELALLKQCVGEVSPPFVVKQIWDAAEAEIKVD